MSGDADNSGELRIAILGRTLEHLGVQMYKRREAAIAELVANAWDAGARTVRIRIDGDSDYDKSSSAIVVEDDGCGMTFESVRDHYLLVGRNRRERGEREFGNRPVMGRKGIGKLAGFGLAQKMVVESWREASGLSFELDSAALKTAPGQSSQHPIPWKWLPDIPEGSGTRVTLSQLKHTSALDPDALAKSLARRFTRRVTGQMAILVNGQVLPDPTPELQKRLPEDPGAVETHTLQSGAKISYWYGFTSSTIRDRELRGFTIQVNGKTAQAPPFFFDVEGTASGQHATRYVIGEIEADFLDDGTDDESDIISTDRQELDWDNPATSEFKQWGESLARRVLRECTDFRGSRLRDWILQDEDLRRRIAALDEPSQTQVERFLRLLGPAVDENERARDLASSLVRAFEYRHFHDVLDDLENASDDPERLRDFLEKLQNWRVLEGRAILEVIKGRLQIIDKLRNMVINNAPETAHRSGDDNLHDLLASFPWLLNPEWQVLSEERTLTSQLREWGKEDIVDQTDRERYDFLALHGSGKFVVIEIKRSGHQINLDDLQRAERYTEKLRSGSGEELFTVVICGDGQAVSDQFLEKWEKDPNLEIRRWASLCDRTRAQYERHRALLEGTTDQAGFAAAQREVAEARRVVDDGAFRGTRRRRLGLGEQDTPTDG